MLVKLVDNLLGWNTDSGDKDSGTGLDDNVRKLTELTLGVVVAVP
jgi:hypothetical protein